MKPTKQAGNLIITNKFSTKEYCPHCLAKDMTVLKYLSNSRVGSIYHCPLCDCHKFLIIVTIT